VHQVSSLPQPQCMLLRELGYPLEFLGQMTWGNCTLKGVRPLVVTC
jgi:hypothetical protein